MESDPRLGSQYIGARYRHLIDEVTAELAALADDASRPVSTAGRSSSIPGIGFGKTVVQNMALINHLDRLKRLGYPLLIGPSRKSFIGQILDLGPEERDEGTAACVAIGIARGADIVRVHDVKGAARVAKMADAIIRAPADGAARAEPGARLDGRGLHRARIKPRRPRREPGAGPDRRWPTRWRLAIRSSVLETRPQYVTDQPAFLNMVLRGTTDLAPNVASHVFEEN